MNKKKKTDVSYSNINRKELENETVSYFKEIDHRRKHSVERVDRAELQSQHSVSNLSQRSVSPYCGRGRVNLKNQESNELPKHSHRSMVANRLMHQDSNPLNRGESADNLQMQPKRTASNSSTNKLRSKYSNPILQNDLNDNNLNNVSEIEAYNRKMSNSSVNKFKQQQNINQNSQQVSKLQLGSLTRNSSHAS